MGLVGLPPVEVSKAFVGACKGGHGQLSAAQCQASRLALRCRAVSVLSPVIANHAEVGESLGLESHMTALGEHLRRIQEDR